MRMSIYRQGAGRGRQASKGSLASRRGAVGENRHRGSAIEELFADLGMVYGLPAREPGACTMTVGGSWRVVYSERGGECRKQTKSTTKNGVKTSPDALDFKVVFRGSVDLRVALADTLIDATSKRSRIALKQLSGLFVNSALCVSERALYVSWGNATALHSMFQGELAPLPRL